MKKASSKILTTLTIVGVIALIIGGIALFDQFKGEGPVEGLKVGTPAPDFSVKDYSGKIVSLSDYKDKNLLLYFNEGPGCAPCWQQIIDLQKEQEKFLSENIAIATIGVNSADSWKPIIEGNNLKLPILLDLNKKMSRDYETLDLSSSMHAGESPGHTFVLVGTDKKIKWVSDYPDMRVTSQEILDKIKITLK
ncbi:MAG: peroxiredoxin family protein [Patescibacteria group bacterium]|nr:peroxiredoxin family protein [Patescibacteria group bacterium]